MTTPSPNPEIEEALDFHYIKGPNLNLGQYRSMSHCACGVELLSDGHAQDYRSSMTRVYQKHIAVVIEALVSHREALAEKRMADKARTALYPFINALPDWGNVNEYIESRDWDNLRKYLTALTEDQS